MIIYAVCPVGRQRRPTPAGKTPPMAVIINQGTAWIREQGLELYQQAHGHNTA